jgi:hypothetical protein
MSPKNTILFLLYAASAFGSCHKSGGSSSSATTVYTAGYWGNARYNVAAYWVNSRLVSLTDTMHFAWAKAICVSDSDVYVAGMIGAIANTYSNIPVYWKNGQAIQLGTSNVASIADAIVVANGNVYVAGDDDGYAVYWVNGQETRLNGAYLGSVANSLAISGSDVYVIGADTLLNPCFWKNGQRTELQGKYTSPSAIAVSGDDVYIAGQQIDTITGNRKAIVWKNGELNWLSDGSQDVQVNSISIDGTDLYVCGNTQGVTSFVATVWKDGQLLPIEAGFSTALYAWGVAAVNGAVYVGGNESSPGQTIAAYWSAGGVVELDKNAKQSSNVWGIFVK